MSSNSLEHKHPIKLNKLKNLPRKHLNKNLKHYYRYCFFEKNHVVFEKNCNFFSSYIDPLLTNLKQSGVGCHMNNVYMGALSYADVTLLSPSIRG